MHWESLSSRVIAGVVGFCALCAVSSADIVYVDANLTTGANDGTSWENARRGPLALAAALLSSHAGDEIWVADGRYIPGTSRISTFGIRPGVAVYGGFAGGETQLDQRNPDVNVALLSGDLSNDDAPFPSITGWSENAYHVVTVSTPSGGGTIDGFTITHGYANGPTVSDHDRGGGVICLAGAPTLSNLRVRENRAERSGGGVYLRSCSGWLTDCRLESNIAGLLGGGLVVSNAHPEVLRCLIADNSAIRGGGAEVGGSAVAEFTNCVITRNESLGLPGGGGACVTTGSVLYLFNCTVYANAAAAEGGGILTTDSVARIFNSIIYANVGSGDDTQGQQLTGAVYNVSYCCVQHGYAGGGNIEANPMLADPSNNDFTPTPGSPVIDAGRNPAVPVEVLVDFAGNPRLADDPDTVDTGLGKTPIVDMGALEYQPPIGGHCPEFVQTPGGTTYCRLATAYFGFELSAPAEGYQWRKDGLDIPGETTDRLEIPGLTNADEGAYTVVVFTDGCPALLSPRAHVVVCMTDANCDHVINSTDVSDFVNQWYTDLAKGGLRADFDENGVVNSTDVSNFINVWFEEAANGC